MTIDTNSPFKTGWWAFDLPDVRPCDGTYCHSEYETLPPLDESLFRGDFHWLTMLDDRTEAKMSLYRVPDVYSEKIARQLASLQKSAKDAGVTLPAEFVLFMQHPDWQLAIPSCTACEFDLSTRVIPSTVESGAFIVRFLNDQQDVLLWYLYLTPTGSSYVICSPIPFDDPEASATEDQIKAYTVSCAPSFEAFLYRIWIENRIWFASDEHRTLTPIEQAYLDHYKKGAQ